jgi:SOS-response transcriptional repressor LexA
MAKRLGVTAQAISQWERNKTRPTIAALKRIAKEYNAELDWLLQSDKSDTSETARVKSKLARLLNSVQAGQWTEVSDEFQVDDTTKFYEVADFPEGEIFALQISGESMEPVFEAGDIIIIDTGVAPAPGDFVVAKLDAQNEATFKKYRVIGTQPNGSPVIELVPLNSDFPTLTLSAHNPGRIIGTMIEHRKFRKRGKKNGW